MADIQIEPKDMSISVKDILGQSLSEIIAELVQQGIEDAQKIEEKDK